MAANDAPPPKLDDDEAKPLPNRQHDVWGGEPPSPNPRGVRREVAGADDASEAER